MSNYQLQDGNVIVADADFIAQYHPNAVLIPDSPVAPQPKSMTAIDFYRKIPATVRIAIRTLAVSDPVAADFMHTLDNVIAALGNVRQDDPDAVAGMAYLVTKGCLTQAQADAIWA